MRGLVDKTLDCETVGQRAQTAPEPGAHRQPALPDLSALVRDRVFYRTNLNFILFIWCNKRFKSFANECYKIFYVFSIHFFISNRVNQDMKWFVQY